MKKVELLSPAGDQESLEMAVKCGANAVYLGGNKFGARASANNFSSDEIVSAISYAHIHNVKVYVTVNTVIFDEELPSVIAFVQFLYENDVDGIIIQDLGLLTTIRAQFPDLKLIASTQMNVHSVEQAKYLKSLGIKRIVLARELTLQQIKEIKEQVDIEVEVFSHGAICVSYSGNCLMSSFIGKRSGNRGRCAQPCRLPYQLVKDQEASQTKYWMSSKELYSLDEMDLIHEAGIDSLKIEGRMKGSDYVGIVTKAYRKQIDRFYETHDATVEESDVKELLKIYNRGFTHGYLGGTQPFEMTNIDRPNHQGIPLGKVKEYYNHRVVVELQEDLAQFDGVRIIQEEKDVGFIVNRLYLNGLLVNQAHKGDIAELDIKEAVKIGAKVIKTTDYLQSQEIKKTLNTEPRKRSLTAHFEARLDQPMKLTLTDEITNRSISVISDQMVSKALNHPMAKERILEQLTKLGDTPFILSDVSFALDDSIYMSVKAINELRRAGIEQISKVLETVHEHLPVQKNKEETIDLPYQEVGLCVKVHTIDQLRVALNLGIKTIYYDDERTLAEALALSSSVIPSLPRISFQGKKLDKDTYLIQDVGTLYQYGKNKMLITDAYMNVTNHKTLHALYLGGAKRVTLSPELSLERIHTLIDEYQKDYGQVPNVELIVWGRYDLMISKYCPINKSLESHQLHCMECQKYPYSLKDRLDYSFPIIGDPVSCHVRILNSKRVHLNEYISALQELKVAAFRLEFTIEQPDEVRKVIEEYQASIAHQPSIHHFEDVTYGHFLENIR